MANEELQIVRLRDEFYRDGFYQILIAIVMITLAIGLLIAISLFLYLTKPKPVVFATDNDWRVLAPVPVEQPYLKTPDLIQWVSEIIPRTFTYDFIHYSQQIKELTPHFTAEGWKKFLEVLNKYINYNNIQEQKLFTVGTPSGAPFVINQGILQGRYGWWVQMPIVVSYSNYEKTSSQEIVLQVLVVRIPTLNNLNGVAIDNVVVPNKEEGTQAPANG